MQWRALYSCWETLVEATFDGIFDRWYRLDFGGIITQDCLLSEHREALTQATAYEAVTGLQLRVLVSEALRINADFATFVDLGAGKGKACIYAARDFNIGRIVGVDFSPPLLAIARANARKAGRPAIEFLDADVTGYRLPSGDTLVYINNPFEAPVLEAFLANNLDHFRSFRSVIAYENDRHRASLAKFGFETVHREQTNKRSLYVLPRAKG